MAKIYIGKTTIHGKNNEIVTADWRTPICSLYYDKTLCPVFSNERTMDKPKVLVRKK